jgi:hypothetical protein
MGGRARTPERIAPPLLPRRLRLVCGLLSVHRGCNRSMRTPMAQSHRPGGPRRSEFPCGRRAIDRVASGDTRPTPEPSRRSPHASWTPPGSPHPRAPSSTSPHGYPDCSIAPASARSPLMRHRGAPPSTCLHRPHLSPPRPYRTFPGHQAALYAAQFIGDAATTIADACRCQGPPSAPPSRLWIKIEP